MKQQAHTVAQRLLNLYRQEHVIDGGWSVVNKIFLEESKDPEVLAKLKDLPTGANLIQHITNLKNGKTAIDSIEPELLPYGGLMTQTYSDIKTISQEDFIELSNLINNFEPTPEHLQSILNTNIVKNYGDDWINSIRNILSNDSELSSKWSDVIKTWKAYDIWDKAQHIVTEEPTERTRAKTQADMPDYETYLPMFGDKGKVLLTKLRSIISSMPQE
ncbi:MAG: hypothetical protein MJ156_02715 [Alphaproteobacteria bacterium]|nr:hypothetical protein [Alphaproteobacteria bacterium]